MAVWVVGGIVALCGALTLAEVATALPNTGGLYVFIREGWGRLPAFLFGWTELVIIRAAAIGAVATTFAEYAIRLRGHDPSVAPYDAWVHYGAAIAIALLAGVNVLGIRWAARILDLSAIAKYGALLFIAVLAFAAHSSHAVVQPVVSTRVERNHRWCVRARARRGAVVVRRLGRSQFIAGEVRIRSGTFRAR